MAGPENREKEVPGFIGKFFAKENAQPLNYAKKITRNLSH